MADMLEAHTTKITAKKITCEAVYLKAYILHFIFVL
jgi:hypothetical protein